MKKLILLLMIFAFVGTMMPLAALAAPEKGLNAVLLKQVAKHDCEHALTKKASDSSSHKCCDKGICKCTSGNCHSMSKIFGNASSPTAFVSSSSLVFAFDNLFVGSALTNRLNRPPKA